MDGDLLFWLGLIGIYLLRFLSRKSKEAQQKASELQDPVEGVSRSISAPAQQAPAHPVRAESEFQSAIREIKNLIKGEQPAPVAERPPAEHYRTEYGPDLEEEFERRTPGRVSPLDAEDAFERKPAYGGGDFHEQFADEESSFGFHSVTEKKKKPVVAPALVSPKDSAARPYAPSSEHEGRTRESLGKRMRGTKALQESFLISEILGPPVSRRTQSPRRRPS